MKPLPVESLLEVRWSGITSHKDDFRLTIELMNPVDGSCPTCGGDRIALDPWRLEILIAGRKTADRRFKTFQLAIESARLELDLP